MKAPKPMKMQHCFYCGEKLGVYSGNDGLDTCGKRDCDREARDARNTERFEAHENLDRDMGWE
jgi:hypothetical protein